MRKADETEILKQALSLEKETRKSAEKKIKTNAENKIEDIYRELAISKSQLQEYEYILSHDLKPPLRTIDTLVCWIKTDCKDNFDDSTIDNFKLIEENLEIMDTLISNIIAYTKAGSETKKSDFVYINIFLQKIKITLCIPKHI